MNLQIVDVALDAVGDVAVGPVDGDVLAVALGQTIPFLVGEDVEVEGVEGGQVGRGDGLGLTVAFEGLRIGLLRHRGRRQGDKSGGGQGRLEKDFH